MMNQEQVVLVDTQDRPIGRMEKMEAHRQGLLHRAFSVFILNSQGELMLQQRALDKYHSGGLWTNSCCSHPRPGEDVLNAGARRLSEEMGFETQLRKAFDFIYRADLDNDMIEHELDHVLVGYFDGVPELNPTEAADYRWVSLPAVKAEIEKNPEDFTVWFRICFEPFYGFMKDSLKLHAIAE